MSTPDPLIVAVIRTFNPYATRGMDDYQTVDFFGLSAQPLVEALRTVIRDEITRQLNDKGTMT
jgi:hypothetical protein